VVWLSDAISCRNLKVFGTPYDEQSVVDEADQNNWTGFSLRCIIIHRPTCCELVYPRINALLDRMAYSTDETETDCMQP
jgi:hypothetical protein